MENREIKLTEKGLQYQTEIRMKNREQLVQKGLKVQNKIEKLVEKETTCSLDEVREEYKIWLQIYERVLDEHDALHALLGTEEAKANDYWKFFKNHDDRSRRFKSKMEEWVRATETSLSKKFTDAVNVMDSISNAGTNRSRKTGSRASNRSAVSSLTLRRAKEAEKAAELAVQITTLRERQVLEQAKLEVRQKEEELDIRTKLRVSEAKAQAINDIEREIITAEQLEDFVDLQAVPQQEVVNSDQVLHTDLQQLDKYELGANPNAECFIPRTATDSPMGIHLLKRSTSKPVSYPHGIPTPLAETHVYQKGDLQVGSYISATQPNQPPKNNHLTTPGLQYTELAQEINRSFIEQGEAITPITMTNDLPLNTTSRNENTEQTPKDNNQNQYQEITYEENKARSGDEVIMSVVRELRKPQTEIKSFSGNPLEYQRFMRQFNTRVIVHTQDDDERMNYLEQYTSGEAHKIVAGYSYLDAKRGYSAALKELQLRYGDIDAIANAFVKKALEWPQLKVDNGKGLDDYAIFLTECQNAVQSIESIKVLEYSENLKRLVRKLPFHLHDRWRALVLDLKEKGKGPVAFSQLVNFVTREAKKANDPIYGRESISSVNQNGPNKAQTGGEGHTGHKGINRMKGSFATAEISKPKSSVDKMDLIDKRLSTGKKPCSLCQETEHKLDDCKHFKILSLDERTKHLKAKGLCFGCFKYGHLSKECRNRSVCQKCQRRHPTLLHRDEQPIVLFVKDQKDNVSKGQNVSSACASPEHLHCHTGAGDKECTMAIVPVTVRAKSTGLSVTTYAFLDPGSTITFCSEDVRKRLGVGGRKANITLNTMGAEHRMSTYILDNLTVGNLTGHNEIELPRVYTKESMPVSKHHIPTQDDINKWPHLNEVILPQIDEEIGILIGNAVAEAYTPLKTVTGPKGSPYAAKTALGWVVWNVVRDILKDGSSSHTFAVNRAEITAIENLQGLKHLDLLVRNSINLDFPERVIDDQRELSQDDKRFCKLVENSIQLVDGHYKIKLPFRNEVVQLPENRYMAKERLKGIRNRMKKDPRYHDNYKTFMNDMIQKGFAEEVPANEENKSDGRVWYIPHHGVYHPKKPEKIRIVFDCAAKHQGVSLNDLLLQGPDLTNSLVGVLLRFRQEPIAIMADIEQMFYQVKVPVEDRDALRFYWWPNGDPDTEPKTYRMTVHVFGATSSPSCANTALKRTAQDNIHKYSPEVLDTMKRNFYVDDCISSLSDDTKAISTVKGLTDICKEGGFHLTKWLSNSRKVLESIAEEERAKGVRDMDLAQDTLPIERALGIYWSVESDTLGFKIKIQAKPATRRGILSTVSGVYDPLGLAAPVILPAKILLQDLCRRNIGWDDSICERDIVRWQQWLEDLPKLESMSVRRCYKPSDMGEMINCQLHHFSDASEKGYGTASYLHFEDQEGRISCALVLGKARVTPLKRVTIPRLELTAAMIAVQMDKMILKELDYKVEETYFWTDSQCILKYIANESTRFHTFVANRIRVIREGSECKQWNYVNTKSNPADDASRGLTVDTFLETRRWLDGPEFLQKPQAEWPDQPDTGVMMEDDPEVKKSVNTILANESDTTIERLFACYSSWTKIKTIVGWFLVLKRNLRMLVAQRKELNEKYLHEHPNLPTRKEMVQADKMKFKGNRQDRGSNIAHLTVEDLQNAEIAIVQYVQRHHFREELKELQDPGEKPLNNINQRTALLGNVKKASKLYKLDPKLKDNIIRLGGRIQRASISEEAKHPIILPKESIISRRILEETHRSVGHLGKNVTLAKSRERFWIISANTILKGILSQCVVCRKYGAKVGQQIMADLPLERLISKEPPFTRTGMDYFGPFLIKRGRSDVKRYGVIFTCFAIRAVHIEMAYALDTDSCINAIRRFLARRGGVKSIRSDNGSNLVGANKELKAAIKDWNTQRIETWMQQCNIEWQFNPPTASHFGGVWERQIRTIRKVLYGLQKEQSLRLDDEGLATLFCEAETIINSRPITAMSEDPNDLEPLSPNHLLTLRSGHELPPGKFDQKDIRRRWRYIQWLVDTFWKRWRREYLPMLQERQKWQIPRRNLQEGDIVLVADNTAPRNSWLMARVLEAHKDAQNRVRSCRVKTKNSEMERPVAKLCLLMEATDRTG